MMVREGYLEEVGLEESREKPGRASHAKEAQGDGTSQAGGKAWGDCLGERFRAWLRGLCRQWGLVKSSHNLLSSGQRSFFP